MSIQLFAHIRRRTKKHSNRIRSILHRSVGVIRSFFRSIYVYAWIFGSVEATQQDYDALTTGLLFVACVSFVTFFVLTCREAAALFDSLKINLALLALGLAMLAADVNAVAEWTGMVGERIRKFWERM